MLVLQHPILIPCFLMFPGFYLIIVCGSCQDRQDIRHSNGYTEMHENVGRYFTLGILLKSSPQQDVCKYGQKYPKQ
jgi:hypothetical protein